MQFQVPQFIETEDKVVGPLTIRQFAYIAVAAVISFTLFFVVKTLIWFFLAAFTMGLGASLAFVKVEGRPLPAVILAAIRFFWQPHQYVWQAAVAPKAVAKQNEAKEQAFSVEKIVAGFALKSAWQTVQTGSKAPEPVRTPLQKIEKYEIFRGITGEKRAARRVDYR